MTPEQITMRARLGAHSKWARTADRTAATEPARQGFLAKLAKQVDPDGRMSAVELAAAVESARKAHYQRMALRSSQARARNKTEN